MYLKLESQGKFLITAPRRKSRRRRRRESFAALNPQSIKEFNNNNLSRSCSRKTSKYTLTHSLARTHLCRPITIRLNHGGNYISIGAHHAARLGAHASLLLIGPAPIIISSRGRGRPRKPASSPVLGGVSINATEAIRFQRTESRAILHHQQQQHGGRVEKETRSLGYGKRAYFFRRFRARAEKGFHFHATFF